MARGFAATVEISGGPLKLPNLGNTSYLISAVNMEIVNPDCKAMWLSTRMSESMLKPKGHFADAFGRQDGEMFLDINDIGPDAQMFRFCTELRDVATRPAGSVYFLSIVSYILGALWPASFSSGRMACAAEAITHIQHSFARMEEMADGIAMLGEITDVDAEVEPRRQLMRNAMISLNTRRVEQNVCANCQSTSLKWSTTYTVQLSLDTSGALVSLSDLIRCSGAPERLLEDILCPGDKCNTKGQVDRETGWTAFPATTFFLVQRTASYRESPRATTYRVNTEDSICSAVVMCGNVSQLCPVIHTTVPGTLDMRWSMLEKLINTLAHLVLQTAPSVIIEFLHQHIYSVE